MSVNNGKYWLGKHHSEETRKKLSDAHKGKQVGENNPFYGKHHSEESKKKMSDAKPKKPINQFTLDGDFIKRWESTKEIERELGYKRSNIIACCKGGYFDKSIGKWHNITHSYGYKWEYAN